MSRTPPASARTPPKLGEHTAQISHGWPAAT
jgi:crotonobetainyl-CoA:carnitine CoA-transferase CaiB-like acyl-CoA transferase